MSKSQNAKTNGHTVAALKSAAPKKPAVKAPAASPVAKVAVKKPAPKPAVKAAAKPAATTAPKPVAKSAPKPAAKTAPKPAAKSAARPVLNTATRNGDAARASARPSDADTDLPKERKAKLVRDSFTMPEQEYAVLGQVKKACIKAGFEIKKSELLRIGVALISQLDLATLQQVLASLPQLKTGRPKND